MGQRELEPDEHGGAEGGQLERRLPTRDDGDDARKREHAHLQHELNGGEAGDPARVVLPPVPGRERRVATELVVEGAVDEGLDCTGEARLEEQDREDGEGRADEARGELQRPAPAKPFGYVSQSGASSRVANFVQPDSATATPRENDEVQSQKPHTRSAGMIASFELEFSVYAVKGNASQPKASAIPSPCPPKRRPTRKSPKTAIRSNAIAVAWAAGSESHFPFQSRTRTAGRRRCTPSARRCRRGRWRTRSGRSSGSSHASSPPSPEGRTTGRCCRPACGRTGPGRRAACRRRSRPRSPRR